MLDAWEDLLARAQRERVLAAEGRWEELADACAERVRLAIALPAPSPEARPLLERLAECQDELTAALIASRADTARELAELQHGREAVRGYAPGAAAGGGWVDESR